MMRRVSERYKGLSVRPVGERQGWRPRARGTVKPSLAPVRNEMLNASGSRRIIMENLVKATARGRQWYATTVRNVLDRADVEAVKEAA